MLTGFISRAPGTAVRRSAPPVDGTIMVTAQLTVDSWFRAANRGPFDRAVERAIQRLWPDISATDPKRIAFARVANAIRLGRGHAYANPAPLMRIIQRTLEQD